MTLRYVTLHFFTRHFVFCLTHLEISAIDVACNHDRLCLMAADNFCSPCVRENEIPGRLGSVAVSQAETNVALGSETAKRSSKYRFEQNNTVPPERLSICTSHKWPSKVLCALHLQGLELTSEGKWC